MQGGRLIVAPESPSSVKKTGTFQSRVLYGGVLIVDTRA
jgi:hypothetical protein